MPDNNDRFKIEDLENDQNPAQEAKADSYNGDGENGNSDYASPEQFEADKSRLIDFLQYPREKRKVKEFLEESYKTFEQESVDRLINRVVHEHESELQGSTPFYKPGHIGALMYEFLNMIGVENAFASGLQHTKSSMTKTVQQRVDEINTLLRGVGGFNRQIKASFSRSAVVYLEQEDPTHRHREKVIFTVNLGDFELRYPLDESANEQITEDGRSVRRLVWDEAVNTLAEIVSNTGMKPKYVKNDKNSCIFTMRQLLLSPSDRQPDEFFTFDLRHVNEEMRKRMAQDYLNDIVQFDEKLERLDKQIRAFWNGSKKKAVFRDQRDTIQKERDFYIGTHPDPREMDTGLVFSIAVNTLKDYTVTKDKMQVIMTKYILALSRIAVDKSMDQQVNTVYQQKQAKPQNFQTLQDESVNESSANEPMNKQRVVVVKKEEFLRKKAGGGRFKP